MAEILFYHLERESLDNVLPALLEKTLDRGWRATIQSDNSKRLEALDASLWTYDEEGFLPHCLSGSEKADVTPIVLSNNDDNKNNARVRFFIDGAMPKDASEYERIVFMFDGQDDEALDRARNLWKSYQDGEHSPTYWQQSQSGSWEKKA